MAVNILSVDRGSVSEKYGIRPGDDLVTINGGIINDMMDLQFYSTDTNLRVVLKRGNEVIKLDMQKEDAYTPLGLNFKTYLIDRQHSCTNKCIFCFVDQLPKGLRSDMYFKDDDERLSFLYGNYVTLTNLSRYEIDRIKKMHISPINISVHTTDPKLRVEMMKNPRAAEINDLMQEFYDADIVMNTQIVLCKNINDGESLHATIDRLQSLYPQVRTVAIVPLGLTRYREKLPKLEGYDARDCRKIIEQVDAWTEDFYREHGERIVYLSDEFYLKAGVEIPESEYYGDYAQLENGVGMVRTFIDNFMEEGEYSQVSEEFVADLAVGEAMYPVMVKCLEKAEEVTGGKVRIKAHKIKNDFFGGNIWVTGLLTGKDLSAQLAGEMISDKLLLCRDMLRSEGDMFLDDMTPQQLSEKLGGVEIEFYPNDGLKFAQMIFKSDL